MSNQDVTISLDEILSRLVKLEQIVTDLTSKKESSQREMTDEDARNILIGECKNLKHNDAAQKLGLSYGQVYSCRLEYTFRHIHKELKEKENFVNPWKKK